MIFSRTQELREEKKKSINQVIVDPQAAKLKRPYFLQISVSSASSSAFQLWPPPALLVLRASSAWQERPYTWPGQRCCVRGAGLSPFCAELVRTRHPLRPLTFCKMELKLGGKSKQTTGEDSYSAVTSYPRFPKALWIFEQLVFVEMGYFADF